jgi:predicted O-methyltransferase YrrM
MKIQKQNKFEISCLRDYKDALYSCLVQLKPKYCLEIGTHLGGTTEVFSTYLDEYCPEGFLVTGDVKEYTKITHPKVKQVLVKSHLPYEEFAKHHEGVEKVEYSENSQYLNDMIYWSTLRKAKSVDTFDFIFIDGNHTEVSFMKDFKLSLNLLSPGGHILIDDVPSSLECSEAFDKYIKGNPAYEIYQFEDWSYNVGTTLVRLAPIR